jgi:hypothetical protein
MAPCLRPTTRLLERTAEAEVRVVVHGVALDYGRELLRRLGEARGAEVGAPECLAH